MIKGKKNINVGMTVSDGRKNKFKEELCHYLQESLNKNISYKLHALSILDILPVSIGYN